MTRNEQELATARCAPHEQMQMGRAQLGPIPSAKRTSKRVMRVRTKAPSATFTYDRDGHFSRINANKPPPDMLERALVVAKSKGDEKAVAKIEKMIAAQE